uniref:Peroxiredoxin-like 2 activated in M-CSF stimulated monocytes n=1 Tax=Lates calcarifer TaxID=8187 RepID=A0A4W6C2P8_LATCA
FSLWYVALVALAALVVAVVLANTDFFLIKSAPASLDELASADLCDSADGKTVKGLTLWQRSGAVILVVRRPG